MRSDDVTRHTHFVVLRGSVDEQNDNAGFLRGLPVVEGFPKICVARANGSIIDVQDPSEFLPDGTYAPDRALTFLT